MMEQYRGAPFGELSPHVFAVADASYRFSETHCYFFLLVMLYGKSVLIVLFFLFCVRAMMSDSQSQSILVSGESGAGKTETTKLIMQYLTFVGGRAATDDRTVEQQVLEVIQSVLLIFFMYIRSLSST